MSELVSILSSAALVVLVAVLLRNLLGTAPAPSADASDTAIRDLAAVLQSRDLTVPRTQDIAVLILTLPDYATLIRERPLEQVFGAVNLFYRVATEVADRYKGEVSSLVGGEITILFGRILPVERPLHVAVLTALEIVERLAPDLVKIAPGCRGASAAINAGPSFSGPVGGEWRRTYTSVGVPVEDAHQLARTLPPNEVRALKSLTARLAEFELAPEGATLRIVKARPAPEAPPPA